MPGSAPHSSSRSSWKRESVARGNKRAEAVAKLASDDGTYRRLKAASATPGVVAENDVDIARENVVGDHARIRLLEENERAAQAVVQSQLEDQKAAKSAARSMRDIESYLRINAPSSVL